MVVAVPQVIRESGIKYTCRHKPHSCPLHDEGPIWVLRLRDVTARLAANPDRDQFAKLLKEQRELQTKVNRYKLHLQQYEKCRAAVKQAEEISDMEMASACCCAILSIVTTRRAKK